MRSSFAGSGTARAVEHIYHFAMGYRQGSSRCADYSSVGSKCFFRIAP